MQTPTTRVVMIGDSSVGKTSLVHRLCHDQFLNDTRPTVSTAFFVLKGDDDQGNSPLQIWDTAGAERYRALNSVYYHNAMGGILVFDLTSRPSFESLNSWVEEFTSLAQPGATVVLVGNKSDLSQKFQVKPDEGEKWAKAHGIKFFQTSASEGTNIQELRDYLFQVMPQRASPFMPSTVNLTTTSQATPEEKGKCC